MTVSTTDIRALDPRALWEHLSTTPESQWVERKSVRIQPKDFATALVALANAEGGIIVVGVSDGALEDLTAHPAAINRLRQAPLTLCSPPVRATFHEMTAESDRFRGPVLVVDVAPSDIVHETGGSAYLRMGDSSMKLSNEQRRELAYDRGAAQFEALPAAITAVSELSAENIDRLTAAIEGSGPAERTLRARGLLTPRGEVTLAAFLLFADFPQEHYPSAHARVTRYHGDDRRIGSDQNITADQRVEGPIPDIITRTAAIVDAWQPTRQALRPEGRFGPVPLIPPSAWLEGIVNAVVHRSYSTVGDHIRVDIFDRRIEISSPGRFPGLVDLSTPLDITRYARNPRIARVCNDVGLTQERGEGIRRIFTDMRSVGLADPIYRQTSGSVILTLTTNGRLPDDIRTSLPRHAERVLEVLNSSDRPLGTGDIAEALHLARPTALKSLHALRDAGLIVWRGTSPRDPRATWSPR